jgi:hypothetical protein
MSEWWTYTLSDFLLFSPRTYYRLLELHNAAIWPAQVVAVALGVAVVGLLWRGPAWRGRAVAAILAAAWLWVAWAFHLERYATINWAAEYFAAGFAMQALLLAWAGLVRGRVAFRSRLESPEYAGLGIFLFALALQPALAPLAGRKWTEVDVFGVAPDPTAVATLGVLLAAARPAWELLPIPVLWCVIAGATLWAMGSPGALVPPLAALLAVALTIRKSSSRRCSDS